MLKHPLVSIINTYCENFNVMMLAAFRFSKYMYWELLSFLFLSLEWDHCFFGENPWQTVKGFIKPPQANHFTFGVVLIFSSYLLLHN